MDAKDAASLHSVDSETRQATGDRTWDKHMVQIGRPLLPRHKRFAMLLVRGASNSEIQRELGYSGSSISVLKSNAKIRAEVERLRDVVFEQSVGERIKELGDRAMDVIEFALTSDSMKLRDRVELAKWVIEKIDGKAGQKVDVQDSSLEKFLAVLNEMGALSENRGVYREKVVPAATSETPTDNVGVPSALAEPAAPTWDEWLDQNCPR